MYNEENIKGVNMRVLNQPIDVICKFLAGEKDPIPVKFQFTREDGSKTVINIDEIQKIVHDPPASNHIITYRCVSYQEDRQIVYDIRFWVSSLKWDLYSIIA